MRHVRVDHGVAQLRIGETDVKIDSIGGKPWRVVVGLDRIGSIRHAGEGERDVVGGVVDELAAGKQMIEVAPVVIDGKIVGTLRAGARCPTTQGDTDAVERPLAEGGREGGATAFEHRSNPPGVRRSRFA